MEVKYQAPRFGEMVPEDVELWADALLMKIHAITGWVVPDGDLLTVFQDQFRKKITESYANANPEEIEFAFRNYGTGVPDWGKQMNLSMIDQVMIPYLARRAELSRVEEQKNPVQALLAPYEDLSDQSMQDWLEHTQHRVNGGKWSVEYMPLQLYEWLKGKGLIKMTRRRNEYLLMAADFRAGRLAEQAENENTLANRTRLSEFIAMKQAGEITGDEVLIIENLAKKMILFDMLKNN